MSRENVEAVRRIADAWHRGDLDMAYDLYDPEIEWDSTRMEALIPDLGGTFHGHEGVRAFWRRWLSAWKDLRFEVQDVVDAGDHVVVLVRNQRQWGHRSGIETEVPPYAHVFTFRNGKIVRWRGYPDQRTALEAVGLRG